MHTVTFKYYLLTSKQDRTPLDIFIQINATDSQRFGREYLYDCQKSTIMNSRTRFHSDEKIPESMFILCYQDFKIRDLQFRAWFRVFKAKTIVLKVILDIRIYNLQNNMSC